MIDSKSAYPSMPGIGRDPRLDSPLRDDYPDLTDQEFVSQYFKLSIQKKRTKAQSPTNALTDAIIIYANCQSKCKAYRRSSIGLYDSRVNERTGKEIGMRSTGQKKGLPDVDIILRGMYIGVEVKVGKDKQSEHQIKRMNEIRSAGGVYFIAKDFDSFKEFFDTIL